MTSCTYRSLAFAKSELEDEDFVFAIVIQFNDLPGNPLRSYVLENWEVMIGEDSPVEAAYVVDFLYDLRQHSHGDSSQKNEFLAQIEHLNVGPIRTKAAGTEQRDLFSFHEDIIRSSDFLYRSPSELESLSRMFTYPTQMRRTASSE